MIDLDIYRTSGGGAPRTPRLSNPRRYPAVGVLDLDMLTKWGFKVQVLLAQEYLKLMFTKFNYQPEKHIGYGENWYVSNQIYGFEEKLAP